MSSTSTMSRSLDRPMMISRFMRSGNSPPWYLPEMKRSAKRGRSFMDGVATKASKILVPNPWQAQANAPLVSRRRIVDERIARRTERIDDAPVDLFRDDQARMAQRDGHRVRARQARGRQRHDPVARRRDRRDLDARWDRPLGELVEEPAARQELPARGRPQAERQDAGERAPRAADRRAHHDELADARVAAPNASRRRSRLPRTRWRRYDRPSAPPEMSWPIVLRRPSQRPGASSAQRTSHDERRAIARSRFFEFSDTSVTIVRETLRDE